MRSLEEEKTAYIYGEQHTRILYTMNPGSLHLGVNKYWNNIKFGLIWTKYAVFVYFF